MSEVRDQRRMMVECEATEEDFTLVMHSGAPFGHHEELRVTLTPSEVERIEKDLAAWHEVRKQSEK